MVSKIHFYIVMVSLLQQLPQSPTLVIWDVFSQVLHCGPVMTDEWIDGQKIITNKNLSHFCKLMFARTETNKTDNIKD